MSSIKDQIITLVKQRHHSHKVALEQEKDPRSKHAIDLIARIREDSRLIELIDSLPEEKPSENLEEAAEDSWALYEYRETPQGLYSSCYRDGFIAEAEWQANQLLKGSPLPEDTVLFQKGVEEGRRLEKDDLVLTWEDMAKIDATILDVNNEFAVDYSKDIDRQKFYEEVLKRFKEIKK